MKRERTGETDGSMNALCDEVRRAASKIQETRNCGVIRLEMPERSAVFLGSYMTVRVYRSFAAL